MPTQAHTLHRVETLESRIAPASITFTDIDGVSVTISSSKGTAAHLTQVAILAAEGAGQELQELRLSDLPKVFKGANISVIKGTLDDVQLVNIGFIDATGLDLGKITIDGDLGRILAGDTKSATTATKALTVGSIGGEGLNTQAGGGDLVSKFLGKLGKLNVKGDFKDASLTALGIDPDPDENVSTGIDARGDIGNIFIGGDLIGGSDLRAGSIYAKGSIGNITVTGSVLGGTGELSGSITSERKMGKVNIGGNLVGGLAVAANFSGRIFASDSMGSVNVTGSLQGGNGDGSGSILTTGGLGNVTILGDLIGGTGLKSGTVGASGQIGKITIGTAEAGGNITGGAGEQSGGILSGGSMKAVKIFGNIVGGSEIYAGSITSAGKIASLFVDGSITGGTGEQSGAIGSSLALGAVSVMGDLVGGSGKNSGDIISTTTIDSVMIQGSVKGGDGELSGAIGCIKTLGPVDIGVDLQGGSALNSGVILSGQRIVSVTVGGSVNGSTGLSSGIIDSAGDIGSVTITGGLNGGSSPNTGTIHAAQRLTTLTIEQDVHGGTGENSALISAGSIGSILVKGDIVQGFGRQSASIIAFEGNLNTITVEGAVILVQQPQEIQNRLQISAGDSIGTASFGDLIVPDGLTEGYITARNSIDNLTVEGSARFFHILAGYTPDLQPATSRARIGDVIIGTTGAGNIEGVDIVAGILPGLVVGTDFRGFGTEGDRPIPPFNEAGISQIDSVVIKGNVIPTNSRADHFGIVAGRIGAVSIAGTALGLTAGLDVIEIQPPVPPGDFTVREVSFKPS